MGITCCYKCQNRKSACHDTCSIYIEEKKEYEASKKRYALSQGYTIKNGDFLGDDGHLKTREYLYSNHKRRKRK